MANKINLTKDEADKIASDLCDQIDSSQQGRESLKQRWDMTLNMYRCDKKSTNFQAADGMESYVFPMYRQKANKIKGTLSSAYFGIKPWVQMIDISKVEQTPPPMPPEGRPAPPPGMMPQGMPTPPPGAMSQGMPAISPGMLPPMPPMGVPSAPPQPVGIKNASKVELTFQSWLESSQLKNKMSTVWINTVHFNCGIAQVYVDDKGNLCSQAINPEKSVLYPCEVSDYNQCITMGHGFEKLRYQLEEGCDSGIYDKLWFNVDRAGMAPNRNTTNDIIEAKDNPVEAGRGDEQIECYELITKLKLKGDSVRKLYIVEVEKESRQLMSLKPYQHSRPWYFVYRTSFDEENMYPSDSIGGVMQGPQLAYNDGNTMMLQGSLMSAFPFTVISGGIISNKVGSYQAGQLYETSEDVKVHSLSTNFNPSAIPMVMQKFEELSDAVAGVSRLGTVQPLPGHTTATAAHGFLAAQQESKDEFVEAVSLTFKEMMEFCFELMVTHSAIIATRMGARWRISQYDNIDPKSIDIQPTGSGTTTDPVMLGQKLSTLAQMSENPNSIFDSEKIERLLFESMDLPYDIESMLKPPVPPDAPVPPSIMPTVSIAVPFEALGSPNLSPAQRDVLEHAGIITASESATMGQDAGTGNMGSVLPGIGGMAGNQANGARPGESPLG